MIIDGHCHAGRGDGLHGPWDTEARIERHLVRARRAGIDRTVVFPVFSTDYGAANARLARIVARHPGTLIGYCAVHPVADAGRVDRLVGRAVEQYGFCGIKVHGHDALPRREVFEAARRWSLPLLVDVVGQVGMLEMPAEQYPDVPLIVPHLGTFTDNWAVQTHLIDQLRRFPNLYADTSGVRYFDLLVRAVRTAGAGKLIFGSDGPYLHPAVELLKVRMLHLPPADEALIVGGNLAHLLGLVPGRADGRVPSSKEVQIWPAG